jgi:FkbH-like protein
LNIAVLSNINIDLLAKKVAESANVYAAEGYGVWVQELLNNDSQLFQFCPAMVFVFLDATELLVADRSYQDSVEEIMRIKTYFENALKSHSNIKFFVADIDYPDNQITPYGCVSKAKIIETDWNQMLIELNQAYPNLYIFRLKELISRVGRAKFYSPKLWYLGGMKYAPIANSLITTEINRIMKAQNGLRKKCLLLDLDNTLWGGVVGELGAKGIELSPYKEGARFYDFQRRIKEIKESGIILGIASKNNWDDVKEVFEDNNNMILKEEDFVSIKANWHDKVDNIKQIAKDLNIGLDSIVFIDDNPVERDAIKQLLPDVTVPNFPQDTTELEQFIRDVWNDYFFTTEVLKEDLEKTALYLQNAKRFEALNEASNMGDYLKSLDTVIEIWQAQSDDIERIAQLTQKTNQFNLTTKRYTEEQIREYINSPWHFVFLVSVKDRYGDNGKVAVIILQKEEDSVKMDSFLMSCRVMGRKIEDQIMEHIEHKMHENGFLELITYYYPTAKNKPVYDLFERLDYTVIDEDNSGNKTYSLSLVKKPERVQYAQVIEKL